MNSLLLAELSDRTFGFPAQNVAVWRERKAARAVLTDGALIALLYVSAKGYYKLPGGGVEEGENLNTALIREVMEEVGSEIKVLSEIGSILELRATFQERQLSICYLAKAISKGQPNFTKEEVAEGFSLMWLPVSEALEALESSTIKDYEGHFIVARDTTFLKAGIVQLRSAFSHM